MNEQEVGPNQSLQSVDAHEYRVVIWTPDEKGAADQTFTSTETRLTEVGEVREALQWIADHNPRSYPFELFAEFRALRQPWLVRLAGSRPIPEITIATFQATRKTGQ